MSRMSPGENSSVNFLRCTSLILYLLVLALPFV